MQVTKSWAEPGNEVSDLLQQLPRCYVQCQAKLKITRLLTYCTCGIINCRLNDVINYDATYVMKAAILNGNKQMLEDNYTTACVSAITTEHTVFCHPYNRYAV